jgi:pyruvate dehydrogenase E2 component (dihydrolipoamide acetyltransferase)
MTTTFCLPDIGEGVHEGEIVAWLVAEGDWVTEDQPLLEIMTDKVTAEIPSPVAGLVASLHGAVGDVVPVGSVMVTFADSATVTDPSNDTTDAETPPEHTTPHPDTPASYSVAGVNGAALPEVTPQASLPAVGLPPLATPATRQLARKLGIDLATVTGTGDGGRITAEDVQQAAITSQCDVVNTLLEPEAEVQGTTPEASLQPLPHALPSKLNTAALGPNPPQFIPPKPNGVVPATPKSTVADQAAPMTPEKEPAPTAPALQGGSKTLPFRGVRRKTAQHLTSAYQTAPHFGYVDDVDMTALVQLRNQLKPLAQADNVALQYLPFVMKAVCRALLQHPTLNSTLDEANQQIVLHEGVNLGFAVATDEGLVVPVIHQAHTLSVRQLAQAVAHLATKARAGMLSRADVQGGTFTLTNIGSIGGLFGFPIINVPEVAILAINTIQRRPVVVADAATGEETIAIRDRMYVSISCDHRVVDGADAARFVNTLMQQLENPTHWLYD